MKSEDGCGIGPEFPHSHALQLLFIISFLITWLIDLLVLKLFLNYGVFIIDLIRFIGFIIILILAIWLIRGSGVVLSEDVINNTKLVREGVYKNIRHPMYFGIQLIYLAIVFLTLSLPCLIAWLLISISLNRMSTYEEMALIQMFKDDYLDYKTKTPKWILRL